MTNKTITQIPPMIYGTAWKEEATAELVKHAVAAGFRGIDTANQKKHYREDYVGNALLELKAQGISREDLFLQSKYTYQEGQDHRLPYDPSADFTTQVKSSFAGSLKNLYTDYLDSYLIHGPRSAQQMTAGDWEVWAAMENLCESGQVRMIGVSNVGLQHVKELCEKARIKPKIVQNRCYAVRGWDQAVREYCLAHQIIYQGFSLLTANQEVWFHPQVMAMAKRYRVTAEQIMFRFAVQIGILPLTGTTDPEHMKEDLQITQFELSEGDVRQIYELG
ncbi:MAG: aldo/keto reductase [Candidatus Omnitrophica bacterium]|nr:aldo/keto reductase [Candidatus Omnitrophota bacterium]